MPCVCQVRDWPHRDKRVSCPDILGVPEFNIIFWKVVLRAQNFSCVLRSSLLLRLWAVRSWGRHLPEGVNFLNFACPDSRAMSVKPCTVVVPIIATSIAIYATLPQQQNENHYLHSLSMLTKTVFCFVGMRLWHSKKSSPDIHLKWIDNNFDTECWRTKIFVWSKLLGKRNKVSFS